jgi:hypothetical protein
MPVQVQAVLMASGARHAQGIVEVASRAGANGVTFLQLLPIGAGSTMAAAEMLDDHAAAALMNGLRIPPGLDVRLRTREAAEGFTVVRADGRVWRNGTAALTISPARSLERPCDLALSGRDGSA